MTSKEGTKKIHIEAFRRSPEQAEVVSPRWRVTVSTNSEKFTGAPSPTQAFLGALAACVLSSIRRGAEAHNLQIDDAKVVVDAPRIPTPEPHFGEITIHITLVSPEEKERLRPIFEAVNSIGTVTNTLKKATNLSFTYEIVEK